MQKREKSIAFVTVPLVIVSLVLFFAVVVSAKTITLNMAFQNSDTCHGYHTAIAPWAKQVEEATNGKVKIQMFPSQTLTKGKDTWDALKTGVADIGWCFHGYWPGMTSLADVISLPALPIKTAEEGSATIWKLYEKFPSIQKQFEANKVLLIYTTEPYKLMTRNKQVKTLEDLKGLKLRVTGGPPTEMMKALGGTPVMIPMPDLYISLEKGVIDGIGAAWEPVLGFRLFEVLNYYTEAPLPVTYFSISMNLKKWNSLTEDVQNAIMSVSGLNGAKFWGRNFFDAPKEAVLKHLKESGNQINIYTLPKEERARWVEIGGKPIWEAWVKKMENEGHKNAREILNEALDILK